MDTPPIVSAELLRRAHLTHEASIRSIGSLYYLAAVICPFAGLAALFGGQGFDFRQIVVAVALVALGFIYFKVGRWLRALDPGARMPTTVLSVLGLLGFPIGTLISVYILYLVHSEKGNMVFSPEYRAAIDATPEIQYKTSIIVRIAVVLLVLMLAFAMVGLVMNARHPGGLR